MSALSHSERATAQQAQIDEASTRLKSLLPNVMQIRGAVILGSGLGGFADTLTNPVRIPYSEIPHFGGTSVSGHLGQIVFGDAAPGFQIACLQGRFHYYEGHEPETIALPIRVLKQLGAEFLIVTNAAGGINPNMGPGQPMLIRDHINLMGFNPLRGPHLESWGARFVDMTEAYDADLCQVARNAAYSQNLPLAEGVYAGVSGPNYETPAEIRMLAAIGADAVGMSTVPEVIVARQAGLRVLGISMISNAAAGITGEALAHADVLATAEQGSAPFVRLMQSILHSLAVRK